MNQSEPSIAILLLFLTIRLRGDSSVSTVSTSAVFARGHAPPHRDLQPMTSILIQMISEEADLRFSFHLLMISVFTAIMPSPPTDSTGSPRYTVKEEQKYSALAMLPFIHVSITCKTSGLTLSKNCKRAFLLTSD